MSRCLSDAALIRLLAGDGTADERAHMTACAACGDRHRRVGSELTTVRHVLLATDPPRTRAVARTRSWAIAAVAAPLVVTLAVWGHVAIRGPDAPGPAARQRADHEASVLLTEFSLPLFSTDGRLAASVPDVGVLSLSADALDRVADCEWPDWAATAGCDETAHVARLLDLFEAPDTEL